MSHNYISSHYNLGQPHTQFHGDLASLVDNLREMLEFQTQIQYDFTDKLNNALKAIGASNQSHLTYGRTNQHPERANSYSDTKTQEKALLEKERDDLKQEKTLLEKERDGLKQDKAVLGKILLQKNLLEKILSEKTKLENERDDLKQEKALLEKERNHLKNEMDNLKQENTRLQKSLSDKSLLYKTMIEKTKFQEERDNLKQENTLLEKERDDLKQKN